MEQTQGENVTESSDVTALQNQSSVDVAAAEKQDSIDVPALQKQNRALLETVKQLQVKLYVAESRLKEEEAAKEELIRTHEEQILRLNTLFERLLNETFVKLATKDEATNEQDAPPAESKSSPMAPADSKSLEASSQPTSGTKDSQPTLGKDVQKVAETGVGPSQSSSAEPTTVPPPEPPASPRSKESPTSPSLKSPEPEPPPIGTSPLPNPTSFVHISATEAAAALDALSGLTIFPETSMGNTFSSVSEAKKGSARSSMLPVNPDPKSGASTEKGVTPPEEQAKAQPSSEIPPTPEAPKEKGDVAPKAQASSETQSSQADLKPGVPTEDGVATAKAQTKSQSSSEVPETIQADSKPEAPKEDGAAAPEEKPKPRPREVSIWCVGQTFV